MKGFTERHKGIIKKYNMQYDGLHDFDNPHPVDVICYKLKGIEFAKKHNVKTAEIYGIYNNIDDVNWDNLPKEFVIHPQKGSVSLGVYVLVNYYDLMRKKYYKIPELIKEYKSDNRYSKELWIEELISNPLPQEFKFYMFNNQIGTITQFERNNKPKLVKFWTADWKNENHNVTVLRNKSYMLENRLRKPINPNKLKDIAMRLSKAIKYPFVRIDLFDTLRGVYLNEITPHPSQTVWLFTEELDKRMGKMWEEAGRGL